MHTLTRHRGLLVSGVWPFHHTGSQVCTVEIEPCRLLYHSTRAIQTSHPHADPVPSLDTSLTFATLKVWASLWSRPPDQSLAPPPLPVVAHPAHPPQQSKYPSKQVLSAISSGENLQICWLGVDRRLWADQRNSGSCRVLLHGHGNGNVVACDAASVLFCRDAAQTHPPRTQASHHKGVGSLSQLANAQSEAPCK